MVDTIGSGGEGETSDTDRGSADFGFYPEIEVEPEKPLALLLVAGDAGVRPVLSGTPAGQDVERIRVPPELRHRRFGVGQ